MILIISQISNVQLSQITFYLIYASTWVFIDLFDISVSLSQLRLRIMSLVLKKESWLKEKMNFGLSLKLQRYSPLPLPY